MKMSWLLADLLINKFLFVVLMICDYSFSKKQQNAPKEVEAEVKQVAPQTNNTGKNSALRVLENSDLLLTYNNITLRKNEKPTQIKNIISGDTGHNFGPGTMTELYNIANGIIKDAEGREYMDEDGNIYVIAEVDRETNSVTLEALDGTESHMKFQTIIRN